MKTLQVSLLTGALLLSGWVYADRHGRPESPGNSGAAPGQQKEKGPGKSGSAPGQNKEKDKGGPGKGVDNSPPPEGASVDEGIFASVAEAQARGCDWLDPNYCMYPFPNDHFTVGAGDPAFAAMNLADPMHGSNDRRIAFNPLAMPRNRAGRPIDPTEWNRNDGFSPGQMIQARIPGLSLRADAYRNSGDKVPRLTAMQHALHPRSIISVFRVVEDDSGAATGLQRHLVFAEIDQNITKAGQCGYGRPAEAIAGLLGGEQFADALAMVRAECESTPFNQPADPAADPGPALLIRPAANFVEGARYIVALRSLRDANGELLETTPEFRVYRDNLASSIPMVQARRAHFEEIFRLLGTAGISRAELNLAWDFTVISRENLTGRLQHMVQESVAWMDGELASPRPGLPASTPLDPVTVPVQESGLNTLQAGAGAHAGAWRITSINEAQQPEEIQRTVKGLIKVPGYMTPPGGITGSRMYFDPVDGDGLPDRVGGEALQEASFTCRIPKSASAANPARPSLYGHGLLGGQGEVESSHVRRMGLDGNLMFCGMDWIGMSTQDVPQAAAILLDFSNFPLLADRTQQGILQFIMMGYLLNQENGIVTDPAFHDAAGKPLFSPREVFYDGNSQGGIMGGAVVAMSPNIRRGVLGVPGMNYSTLLRRSVDFDGYGAIMYTAYPNSLDQSFLLSMVQMLWDRGESSGYFNTLADQPEKAVLLHVGYGDHQVADIAADAMARTAGAKVYAPVELAGGVTSAVPADRHDHEIPYYGIERLSAAELDGANTGTPWRGSALVVWDIGPEEWNPGNGVKQGTERTPACNRTLVGGGQDPHEAVRRALHARQQKTAFLDYDGRFVNFCRSPAGADQACFAFGGNAFTDWAYRGGTPDAYQSPCEDP